MPTWTKRGAIERARRNLVLQMAVEMEPELKSILDEATKQRGGRGYHRIRTYIRLRNQATAYVGWCARDPRLRTRRFYSTVIRTIDDLLPPDAADRTLD